MPHPDRLRLTYNADGLMGSAWSTEQFDASKSWSTIFRFQISHPSSGGGDGIGFHIHENGLDANPGHEGWSLSDSHFSLIIDTWNNGNEGTDESLRLIVNGEQIYINDLLDYDPDPNPGSSSSVFRMELNYVEANQELAIRFFDEGGSDALFDSVLNIDLDRLDNSWAGFSAVTGMSTQNHDIRTWMLNAATPPSTLPGDVNQDGNIDVIDIVLVVNMILDDAAYNELADMNNDNVINVVDIVAMVNLIL
jgi:hypothetical protein